jgi:uncharacterized OsmC-like protein
MATTMGIKARDLQVDLIGMKISTLKIMKADPRRIGGINIVFAFPPALKVDEKQRLILERTAHTCPAMLSLHPDIEVKVEFNWNEAQVPA